MVYSKISVDILSSSYPYWSANKYKIEPKVHEFWKRIERLTTIIRSDSE